jgi:hypothetical protein
MPPAVVPDPPRITLRPKASNQALEFFWNTPASDGGSAITAYTLICDATSYSQSIGPSLRRYKVTGLTNGTKYSFYLVANNAVGPSAAAYFRTVEPGLRPSVPQTVSAVADPVYPAATVSWAPPTSDGGAEIGWYVVKSSSSSPADPVRVICTEPWKTEGYVENLNTTSSYTFKVYAVNDPGYSPAAITNSIAPTSVIQDGLLVWLTANTWSGTGTWYDGTSNHYDATLLAGSVALNAASNGIVLDGASAMTFPTIGSQSVWTISVWFKRTGASASGASIVTEIFTGSVINIVIKSNDSEVTDTEFAGGFFNGGWQNGTPITFPLNEWHQMVITWNGTNIVTYYDSTPNSIVNKAGQTSSGSGNAYVIGRRWDIPYYVTGEIGEVLIYNRALNSSEVIGNYGITSPIYS